MWRGRALPSVNCVWLPPAIAQWTVSRATKTRVHNRAPFCPRRLPLRGRLPRDDAQLVRCVTDVTHLHLHLSGEPRVPIAGRPADMALRVVVLEVKAPGGWLFGSVIPFFLSCPALERVLVCSSADAGAGAELAAYAAEHCERRIWLLDYVPADERQFCPGSTFDPLQWTRGRQLGDEA